MNRFRLLVVCALNLGNGMVDSAAGALIPYMEKYYDIEYGVVSLIFVGQSIGFVLSAVLLEHSRAKLGRAKTIALGQILIILGCISLVCNAPWVVNVLSFILIGYGLAASVAMGNIFCGGLRNSTSHLGLFHGSYGIRGTTGPLIATAMMTITRTIWSRFYLIPLGFSVFTLGGFLWAFWNFEKEQSPAARAAEFPVGTESAILGMARALKTRTVLLGALFIFAYQGAEVSISGWVIFFLINARGGDPSSAGYVSSGFWAGITLGRFLLSGPAQRIGEKRFVCFSTIMALLFQVLVWVVPHIVTNAVAVSIVGLMLGPIYPCCAAVFLRALARSERLSGKATISASGSLGGAMAPFWAIPAEEKRDE
ncbi:Bypass of stop codon protein-like protein [Emericellopsis cladophorae]|uniref:Bypass of stop codon protein-like protein n=1 Tax=Emericellopsis cladophorae TaxID=2686198 RepID=A0A9Q0BFL9_9HYPO|nr:Bypass of stop codon protein-like protein [Emericellopsis cladophorae]KAI6782795.1 Bypass of stop codon protein-like protein [Emericellopsis cladophorae]